MSSYFSTPPRLPFLPLLVILVTGLGLGVFLMALLVPQILESTLEVSILAQPEAGKTQPYYLECQAQGVVLYPEKTFVAIAAITGPNSPLEKFLAHIALNRAQNYLILAIRPQGIETFQTVRTLILAKGIAFGYEPLNDNWQLTLPSKKERVRGDD